MWPLEVSDVVLNWGTYKKYNLENRVVAGQRYFASVFYLCSSGKVPNY